MIQLLHDDGYRNAAGLSSIEDDEWKDYKVPKSVQKAIKKVLASNSSGGGGGMSSSVGTNEGTLNNIKGDNHKFDQSNTNYNAPQN